VTTYTLIVKNNSNYTVDGMYLRSCGASSWGSDLLTTSVSPGQQVSGAEPAGCFDLKAQSTSSNLVWLRYAQTIQGGGTYTWTLGN
jgi:hypothetical protein